MENENKSMMVQISTKKMAKFRCQFCNKALPTLIRYVKHIKKHEPPGGFSCRYCNARFCFEAELRKHRDAQHTLIVCRLCKDATFINVTDYRTHVRTVHNGIDRQMYKCDKCGAEYKTIEPFKRHMTTECGTVKPHKCDLCSMSFMTKYNLQHHKEAHKGELKFCCSYCGKNFQQKGRLVEHERSHTGEKPYRCDVCGKCFAHRESIVTHSSIHTGIRLVECKCCQTRFSCYSNLIKHRRARLETCGRAEYDPPKTRIRKHSSRIPPALNPTSEIKVGHVNKIIKPDDQRKADYRKDISHQKSIHKKIKKVSTGVRESTKDVTRLHYSNEERGTSNLLTCFKLDPEPGQQLVLSDIDKSVKEVPESNTTMRSNNEIQKSNDLETQYLASACNDKLYKEESLVFLNHDNYIQIDENSIDINFVDCQSTNYNANILEETEIVLPNSDMEHKQIIEEDVLEVKPLNSNEISNQCRILLQDVKDCFPQLRHCNTIKITDDLDGKRNRKYMNKDSKPTVDQKRNFGSLKITQSELKERLQFARQMEKCWKCPHCIKIYYLRRPFEKHLLTDHQVSESDIQQIIQNDDGIPFSNVDTFKCHICPKIYLIEKRFINHMQKHGDNGELVHKCPRHCSRFFASREEAINHARLAHNQKLWCELCKKYMTGHDSLESHNARLHNKTKRAQPIKRNLICDKCGKKFQGRTQLTDHIRSDCGRSPIYQCKECGKCLTTAGILKTHMSLHNNDRPFQCKQCGKSFKVKAQYRSHVRYRHSENKRFKCHLCSKAYPYRESLLVHMTVHTGIKRFLCNWCGKRFTCISNLQAHRKVQSDTCGLLPLNAKATQYMGVQKGQLLMGAKPEASLDYIEANTVII